MELTEIELVRAIRKVLSGSAPGVVVGVGDDAAVLDPRPHPGVLTTDMLVEGVHFEIGATSAHDLGHKAVTVNVSDVAAMGGSPRYAVACVAVSPRLEASWVMELYGGMRQASADYGMVLVGGDTSRADRVVLSVTVLGEVGSGRHVTRAGAGPGDALVVTGELGGSAGGLWVAQAKHESQSEALSRPWGRALVARHERPVARVGEGQTLAAARATAMMDVSDGLAIDLARLCEESGCGARVRLADIPLAEGLEELQELGDVEPLDLALHGGEDYELLAAVPKDAVEPTREALMERFDTRLTEIGEITSERGLVAVSDDGSEDPLESKGWDHFA
ncbi:MAG: thiamine-phosphate kinase [Actinomycetota bacterium]